MTSAIPDKYNLDTDTLNSIYDWVDQVPLSRPKKNIARDFSDAGMQNIASLKLTSLILFKLQIYHIFLKLCSYGSGSY